MMKISVSQLYKSFSYHCVRQIEIAEKLDENILFDFQFFMRKRNDTMFGKALLGKNCMHFRNENNLLFAS